MKATFSNIDGYRTTLTGRKIFLEDPQPDQIHHFDIAHALAGTNHWGGMTDPYFNVAQHSVLVAQILPDPFKLVGLLHDAPEAYLHDLGKPLKEIIEKHSTIYASLELNMLRAILKKYGVDKYMVQSMCDKDGKCYKTVKEADIKIQNMEWEKLFKKADNGLVCWAPAYAKMEFLKLFAQLTGLE